MGGQAISKINENIIWHIRKCWLWGVISWGKGLRSAGKSVVVVMKGEQD